MSRNCVAQKVMDAFEQSAKCPKGSLHVTDTCQRCEEIDDETLSKIASSLGVEDVTMSRAELCVRLADVIDRRASQARRASRLQLPANLLTLPADVVRRILSEVDINTLLMACQTSVQVRAICNDPRLWKLMWGARFPGNTTSIMRTSNDAGLLRKEFLSYARKQAKVYDFHQHSYSGERAELPIPHYLAGYLRTSEQREEETRLYKIMREDIILALQANNELVDNILDAWKQDVDEGNDVGDHFDEAFNKAFIREDGEFQVGTAVWESQFAPLLKVAVQDAFNPNRLSTNTLCNLDLLQNSIFVEDSLALPQRLLSGDLIVGDNLTYWYVQHDENGTRFVPFSQNALPEVAWERFKVMGTPADFWNTPLRQIAERDPRANVYPRDGFQYVIAPSVRDLTRYPDKRNAHTRALYRPLVGAFDAAPVFIVPNLEALFAPRNLSFPGHELARKVASIVANAIFPFDGCIPLLSLYSRSKVEVAVTQALQVFPLATPEVMASLFFLDLQADEEYDAATTELAQYLRDTWYDDSWWNEGWKVNPWWSFLTAIKDAAKGPSDLSRESVFRIERSTLRSLQNAFYSRTTTQSPLSITNIRRSIEQFASMYSLLTHDSDDEASQAFLESDKWKTQDLPRIVSLLPANTYWITSLKSLLTKLNLPLETTVGELSTLLQAEADQVPVRRTDVALVEQMQPVKAAVARGDDDSPNRVLEALRRSSGTRQLVAVNAILGFRYPHILYPCMLFYAPGLMRTIVTDIPDFEERFNISENNAQAYRRRLDRYEVSGRSTESVKKSIEGVQREYEENLRLLDAMDNFTPLLYNVWLANAPVDESPPTFTVFEKQLASAILQSPGSLSEQRELVLRETYPALVDDLPRKAYEYKNLQDPWISLQIQEEDERIESLELLRNITGLRLAPTKDQVERQLDITRQVEEDRIDGVISKYENVIEEDDIENALLEEMLAAYNANQPQEAVEIWNRAMDERNRPEQAENPNLEEEELAAALGGREQVELARREEEQVLGVARALDEQ